MNQAGFRYALCGGLAVHGHARATQDIDLLIPEEELAEIQQLAETAGFWIPSGRIPFKTKTPLAIETYRVSKAVGSILRPLYMIIVSLALQQVWETRRELPLGTIHCPIVSIDGLIRMKTIAGRLRDLADIESLIGALKKTDGRKHNRSTRRPPPSCSDCNWKDCSMIFAGFFKPASGQCVRVGLRLDNSPKSLPSHRSDISAQGPMGCIHQKPNKSAPLP